MGNPHNPFYMYLRVMKTPGTEVWLYNLVIQSLGNFMGTIVTTENKTESTLTTQLCPSCDCNA